MNRKYQMIQKAGALQEGFTEKRPEPQEQALQTNVLLEPNVSSGTQVMPVRLRRSFPLGGVAPRPVRDSQAMESPMFKGPFRVMVPEGSRVLMIDRGGVGRILVGPCRVWRRGRTFHPLKHQVAYPGEFLIVRFKDGLQEHPPGPVEVWVDPRRHASIEKEEALQIAAKESVVVYSKEPGEEGRIHRRIVTGPAIFVPEPGEWLHTFHWHGSEGHMYKKVPGALVFQKLWLMPDQMYHDVEEVRTADDVILTIKLMLFFELVNVERMLDATHDPIGDFINATSSDVIDLVGRTTFDQFKLTSDALNDLKSYHQLLGRAEQVGYRVHKIVSRGYTTTAALQAMHDQAIETRTRLKLEKETENQAQELTDFKQDRECQRAQKRREQDKDQLAFDLERQRLQHQQELMIRRERGEFEREERGRDALQDLEHQQGSHHELLDFYRQLQQAGVDLTSYLTQGRADQVIELRGGPNGLAPHIHLGPGGEVT